MAKQRQAIVLGVMVIGAEGASRKVLIALARSVNYEAVPTDCDYANIIPYRCADDTMEYIRLAVHTPEIVGARVLIGTCATARIPIDIA